MTNLRLSIDGMHCEACVRRVDAALQGLDGVKVERVAVGEAELSIDPTRADAETVARVVSDAGYPASIAAAAG
jgi:copper chaperone